MGDAAFVAETKQSKLELDPQGGKQLAADRENLRDAESDRG
jgi:hypothetical protein